ncbi:hypothetical protein L4C34_20060 [Vibrio profundum]|uniref:hypothetical protein n=1 Tax=Vibrio profundum TaxID=2910247 RepID=UPI003D0D12A8
MTQRNIHGFAPMTLNGRILHSEVTGASNKELGDIWFNEMKETILSSPEKDTAPWALLIDCRNWGGGSLDSWEASNRSTDWMIDHNCVFGAIIVSNKVQHFAIETQVENQDVSHYFVDFDEAYKACLEKLAEAQSRQE